MGAALGCGQASLEAPLPSPWKAWPVGEPLCGGLTVQLVLREAGPAQVPHGVESYGVGLWGWSGRGWGAEGAGGRQQTEEVSTHTPPRHRDPDEGAGWEDTCRGKGLPDS